MVSEPTEVGRSRFRLASVVKAMYAPEEYREAIERRSAAFERAYPLLKRRGIMALLLLPPTLLVLASIVEERLPLIALLVAALICIYSFLIVVEYLHDRAARKQRLTSLTADELEVVLAESLREEVLAAAPIDALLEAAGRERPHERVARRIHERIEDARAARAATGYGAEEELGEADLEGDAKKGGDVR